MYHGVGVCIKGFFPASKNNSFLLLCSIPVILYEYIFLLNMFLFILLYSIHLMKNTLIFNIHAEIESLSDGKKLLDPTG